MLPILLAAANIAPFLMKYMGAGKTAEKVAQDVADLATVVAGGKTPEESIAKIQSDPKLTEEFKVKITAAMKDWDEMYLKDVQDARARDLKMQQAGYRNYRAHSMYILAIIVIGWLVYIVWKDPNLPEYAKGIFTLVLGRFLGYLDNIYNFEFGTTRQSRNKDDAIDQLTKKVGG
jgi:hypothetical protein